MCAMDLEQYQRETGISWVELSRRIGRGSRMRLRRIARGEVWPDAETLEAIFAATGGRVTLEAMHDKALAWQRAQGRAPSVAAE